MADISTTLQLLIQLKDEATAGLKTLGGSLQSLGQNLKSTGTTLTTEVSLPILSIGTAALYAGSQFQAAMTQLVTQAGLPASALKGLTDQVLAFASSGAQQTPEVLAQGLYHIISLGVPASDAMGVLKSASAAAAMSGANLEDVANALGGAVASNIKGAGDYKNAMAVLNATTGAGNMRMQDLATALGNVLPQATTAGLSLRDVGAAMATMTDNAMPAADASTRLHMAIALMDAPTRQAVKALQSIGLTQFSLADDMRNKGLLPALQDLHNHLVDSGKTADEQVAVLSQAFGGGRTSGAIELLLNNLDRVQQKYDLIDKGVGKFDESVAMQAETTAAKFAAMRAQISAAAIEISNALLPIGSTVFPKIADAISTVAGWFSKLSGPVQTSIITFLAFAAAIGPVLTVVGSLIQVAGYAVTAIKSIGTAMTFLAANPIVLLVAAIAAAAVLIIMYHQQIWDAIKTVAGWIEKAWSDIMSAVKVAIDFIVGLLVLYLNTVVPGWQKGLQEIVQAWQDGWNLVKSFFTTITDWIKSAVFGILDSITSKIQGVVGAWNNMIGIVSQPVKTALGAVSGTASAIGNAFGSVASQIEQAGASVTHFASGGIVTGPTFALVGEAGPEAIIPLNAFNGGGSLARGSSNAGPGSVVVNINGGTYLDAGVANDIANMIAKKINQQLRLRTF